MTETRAPYWLYGYDCSVADYLAGLTDEQVRDQYAMRLGYSVCPGAAYRYETIRGGTLYHLVTLPSRPEMVEELCQS